MDLLWEDLSAAEAVQRGDAAFVPSCAAMWRLHAMRPRHGPGGWRGFTFGQVWIRPVAEASLSTLSTGCTAVVNTQRSRLSSPHACRLQSSCAAGHGAEVRLVGHMSSGNLRALDPDPVILLSDNVSEEVGDAV